MARHVLQREVVFVIIGIDVHNESLIGEIAAFHGDGYGFVIIVHNVNMRGIGQKHGKLFGNIKFDGFEVVGHGDHTGSRNNKTSLHFDAWTSTKQSGD